MITALFHLNIDLDHRDQLEPIADDLRDRYGVSNIVWYEIIDGPPEEDA